jgi:hypothetical protein
VIGDAVRIVADAPTDCDEFDDTFEQLLPDPEMEEYYVWNKAQYLFELMCQCGKEPMHVTAQTISRFARIPGLCKH